MKKIEDIIHSTTEETQDKVDWTKAWSSKYPVLATYQNKVDIPKYAAEIRRMFTELSSQKVFLNWLLIQVLAGVPLY